MFLRNGILSDKQFIKHYGKDIFIYPFSYNNLKGASYNLTASPVAYYEENGKYISSLISKNKIMLKPKKITFIQTNESIYVTQRISGTYHTKVKWAAKGLSAISTTLDPCYFGTSLITIVNLSDKEVEVDVGESLCTIIFHKITSGSKDLHDNTNFRKDVISGRVYEFKNVSEIQNLKEKLELEEIKISQKLDVKCQNCLKEEVEGCVLKENCSILKSFVLRNNLGKREIAEKILEYKNYLELWYEEDFRNQKISLVNKVKENLRVNISEKIKKSVNGLIFLTYIIAIGILFLKFDIIKKNLGDKNMRLVEFFGYLILPLGVWIYPNISKWLTEVLYKFLNRKEI